MSVLESAAVSSSVTVLLLFFSVENCRQTSTYAHLPHLSVHMNAVIFDSSQNQN